MLFKDIQGLVEIKERIVTAVHNNKVPHAQLFLGTEGGANLALALAYSTFLNCTNRLENDACGECHSCRVNLKFSHPDVHFVYPVSTVKNIAGKDLYSSKFLGQWRDFLSKKPHGSVDEWSEFFGGENKQPNISKEESRQIIKNLSLTSFEGKYKVMIIWLPEYMHASSANAILKILEEPPDNTIFLMVSNDHEKLLTTILSRTQLINVRPYTVDEICSILSNKYQVEEAKAHRLASLSDGNINTALRLLEDDINDSGDFFKSWLRHCYSNDFVKLSVSTDEFQKLGKIGQRTFLQYGLSVLRETLIATLNTHDGVQRFQKDDLLFVQKFKSVLQPDQVSNAADLLNSAHYHLERNSNAKITFLNLSLNMAQLLKSR